MGVTTSAAVRTVLVADDSELVLSSFKNWFTRTGVAFLPCRNRRAALALAREHAFDVGVIDLVLGTDDGLELLRELRALRPDAHLILITGYGSVDVAVQAMHAGANDVIEKPVMPSDVLNRIERRGGGSKRNLETATPSLERAQYEHVHRVLGDCGGNKSHAARRLGIPRSRLRRLLARRVPKT